MSAQTYIINTVFGISIVLGTHMIYVNAMQYLQHRNHWYFLQLVAAIFQLLNQVCFTIVSNVPIPLSSCVPFTDFADFCYFTFQVFSSTVLIENITRRTPGVTRHITKYALLACFAISVGFTLHSAWVKQRLELGGMCVALYDRNSNQIGKAMLFCIYLILFITFIIPTTKLLLNINDQNKAKEKLNKAVRNVSIQMTIALVCYLTTVALSFLGIWGNYFFVQFTIENYCGIVASTQDLGLGDKSMSGIHSVRSSQKKSVNKSKGTTELPK
jgi:hypothetical protein